MTNNWQTAVSQPDQLGESPFWHPDEQMLYWLDIPGRQVRRLNTFMGSVQSWAMPTEPGCIAPARTQLLGGDVSGFVIALRDGIYRAREWGGALECLMQASHDTATTRFNDGKADPAGRFWAGSMYEPRTAALAELFSIDCRGGKVPVVERKAGDATIANGLAWSPDASTVYWTDTTVHTIRAWDWNADSNVMTQGRVFRQWPGKPAGWKPGDTGYGGRPDGAAVDVQGNYWVAMFEGARIIKLSPAGEILAEIPLPAQCPTMPCFGGVDLKTLYVTTASKDRPAHELALYPDSGCVFSMQVDVPGLPVNFFLD
jgi:sugar lactone lactonase YvrE